MSVLDVVFDQDGARQDSASRDVPSRGMDGNGRRLNSLRFGFLSDARRDTPRLAGTGMVTGRRRLAIDTGRPAIDTRRLANHSRCGLQRRARQAQEVGQQEWAFVGEEAFGVKLHAFHGCIKGWFTCATGAEDAGLGAEAHDLAFVGPCTDLESLFVERVAHDDEAVITRGDHGIAQAFKQAATVVMDRRGLAVHESIVASHRHAEDLAHALMAEANAHQRDLASECLDDVVGNARFLRRARARRNQDAIRLHGNRFVCGDLVISDDAHVQRSDGGVGLVVGGGLGHHQLANSLDEVVGETVVVIDEQEHRDMVGSWREKRKAESGERKVELSASVMKISFAPAFGFPLSASPCSYRTLLKNDHRSAD